MVVSNEEVVRARITDRDVEVLCGFLEDRFMQRTHVTDLFFDGRDPAARARIGKKLLANRYIREVNPDRYPNVAAIYGLARRGFEELDARGCIARYAEATGSSLTWDGLQHRLTLRPLTIAHELAVMDVKAKLTRAMRREPTLTLCTFPTWPAFFQFFADPARDKAEPTKPDAYMRAQHAISADTYDEQHFFFEIDRGPESLPRLLDKVSDYCAYNGSPAFAQFAGVSPSESVRFRALFVFGRTTQQQSTAEERLYNFLHLVCAKTRVRHFVWATTHHELLNNPLGAIWLTPSAYASALHGTPYDPATSAWLPKGRDAARDALAREHTKKRTLFALESRVPPPDRIEEAVV